MEFLNPMNPNHGGMGAPIINRDEKRVQSYVLSEKPLFLSRAPLGHIHTQSDGPFAARRRGYTEALQEGLFVPRKNESESSEPARARSRSAERERNGRRARTRPQPTPESLKAAYEKVVMEEIKQWESSVQVSSGDDRSDGSPSPMMRVRKSDWMADQNRMDKLLHNSKPVQLRGWGSKARVSPKWLTRSMTSPEENVTSDSNSTGPSSQGDFDFTAGSVQSSPRLKVSEARLPQLPAARSRGIPAPGPRETILPPANAREEPEPLKSRPLEAAYTRTSPPHILDFPARDRRPSPISQASTAYTKSYAPQNLQPGVKDQNPSSKAQTVTTFKPSLPSDSNPTESKPQDSETASLTGSETFRSRRAPIAASQTAPPLDPVLPSNTPLRLTSDFIENALKPSPPEIAERTLSAISRLRQEHSVRLERSQLVSPTEELSDMEASPSVRPKHLPSPAVEIARSERSPVGRGRKPVRSPTEELFDVQGPVRRAKLELPTPEPSEPGSPDQRQTGFESLEESEPQARSQEPAPAAVNEESLEMNFESQAVSPERDDTFVLLRRLGNALATKGGIQPTAKADLEAIKSEVEGETTATDFSVLEGRLGRGLASIIEAKAGIEDLEGRVAAAKRSEYQPPTVVYLSLPLPLLWKKASPPIKNWRGGRQITWLGLMVTLLTIWLMCEDVACTAYCKPEYLGYGEPLNPNAPFFGGALWYALKEGVAVVLQWWAE